LKFKNNKEKPASGVLPSAEQKQKIKLCA